MTAKGHELAKVTIIDFEFNILLDELVKPVNKIEDYLTQYSGITEEKLRQVTRNIGEIQQMLKKIIHQQTILIGHSLENDLMALNVVHRNVIDTSVLFQTGTQRKIKLKELAIQYFNAKIQQGSHDSVDDAKISLSLAKLRIEILQNIKDVKQEIKGSENYDLLQKMLLNKQRCILIDKDQYILPLLKLGINFTPVKDSSMDQVLASLLKWNKNSSNLSQQYGLQVSRFSADKFMDDQDCIKFDNYIQDIYQSSQKNTIFILLPDNSIQQNERFQKQYGDNQCFQKFLIIFAK